MPTPSPLNPLAAAFLKQLMWGGQGVSRGRDTG